MNCQRQILMQEMHLVRFYHKPDLILLNIFESNKVGPPPPRISQFVKRSKVAVPTNFKEISIHPKKPG